MSENEIKRLRKALEDIQTISECALVGPKRDQEGNLSSVVIIARAALRSQDIDHV